MKARKPKPPPKEKLPKPRCGGMWTEARFRSFVRSALRKLSMRWPPMRAAKIAARRPYVGTNPRQKYESQCAHCKQWFKESETQADHIIPCGSLIEPNSVWDFIERVLCEADGFQILCNNCHDKKTQQENSERRDAANGESEMASI